MPPSFSWAAGPIRCALEFSKAKQGVDDTKEEGEAAAVHAFINARWKLPERAAEIIPARNLSPTSVPELFVARTTPSRPMTAALATSAARPSRKAWEQATTDAAIEVADYVIAHLPELAGVAG